MAKKAIMEKPMAKAETIITCPYCKREIPLDDALTHQFSEKLKKQFEEENQRKERELKSKEEGIARREKELQKKREDQELELSQLKTTLQKEFAEKLAQEKTILENAAKQKAQDELSIELQSLKEDLEEKTKQVKDLRAMELQLRRDKQKIEEEREKLALDVARKIDEERGKIKEEVARQVSEQHRLKEVEKDRHIEALKNQIEDLKRKAEQGPGEVGETLEWILESTLKEHFKHDIIEPVPRGMRGADVMQRVCSTTGQVCGTIIWESKRVKNWSDGWIEKLKEDQREAKADIAVLVSTVLPRGITGIHQQNGVWIADYTLVIGLATALRHGLMEIAAAKTSMEGRSEKLEMLYDYLSGPQFRQQIEAIVDAFVSMSKDLDQERRAMEKIWAKREKQIEKVVKNTSRMYGSLQGIVGSTLPELKTLELKALKGVEDR